MASPDLHARAAEAAGIVEEAPGPIRVVSHYDADGLSAGAILAHALERAGKPFTLTIAKRLTGDVVDRVRGQGELYLFADMGSGDPELFEGIAGDTVVLDHHVPADVDPDPFRCHVNAHLAGVDGTYEASAASIVFLFATKLDEANWDLFPLALAGVVGDRQDRPELSGFNAELAAEGVKRGVVEARTAPRLPPGPLGEALSTSTDPFLVGLAGDVPASEAFLEALDVDPAARFEDLAEDARQRVASRLVARLLDQGCRPEIAREVVGTRYTFSFRGVGDAATLAWLLNSAGRSDLVGDGLGFLLGQPDVRPKIQEAAESYHVKVLDEAVRVTEAGARVLDAIQVVTVEAPHLTGTIAGLAMNYVLDQDRATVALREEEDRVKVSTRGTRTLVDRGLDLAAGCRKAAEAAGGSGGGHTIAAGAAVPIDEVETFLETLDGIVAGQLGQG